ncbi:MAG TPA: type II 3-dehydroquinate dehydratase [Steroidobacteraceae bacterium]|nr:type II 3-dehydroquinate dehydratase [Steroidobacteraceae bacterium]
MGRLLLLNGPNLNLLGSREPALYGADTLASIEKRLTSIATKAKHSLVAYQSNAEHEIIDRIQRCPADQVDFILFNPGGFTHTSVAIRDALLAVRVPFIEVHLSNVHAREAFRRLSYFSDIAVGSVAGFGAQGYEFALQAAIARLDAAPKS